MPPVVHLLRHAQAQHNVHPSAESYNKFHDPVLTDLGRTQATALRDTFSSQPDLIAISPLRRTLETALLGLTRPEIPVVLNADLQETTGYPCDTGSTVPKIEQFVASHTPSHPDIDFSTVPSDWNSKTGPYAPTNDALAKRAAKVRRWLKARPEKQIVVVTHAGFLRWLTGGEGGAFENCEWRTYRFDVEGEDDGEARLVPIHGGDGEGDGRAVSTPGATPSL